MTRHPQLYLQMANALLSHSDRADGVGDNALVSDLSIAIYSSGAQNTPLPVCQISSSYNAVLLRL